ncbi:hypothetical protein ACIBH1_45610 [Nonomuraea sp. NPDC050663]|uniref:hypothetical protein n=1 Tax=Nonomuraea sp. NPDC050663 TaxID=3364370 RepID=UPI003788113C
MVARGGRWIGVALAMVLVSACSGLWTSTARVDPGLVAELRTLGRVVAETTDEWYYDGEHDISVVLILDGGSAEGDAFGQVVEALERRGWKDSGPTGFVSMESAHRPETIYVEPFSSAMKPSSDGFNPKLDSANEALFDRLRLERGAAGYVVLKVEPNR